LDCLNLKATAACHQNLLRQRCRRAYSFHPYCSA
jgi:hypothetical protein